MTGPAPLIELETGQAPPDDGGSWALIVMAADGLPVALLLHDHGRDYPGPRTALKMSAASATLWARGWADAKGGTVYLRRYVA